MKVEGRFATQAVFWCMAALLTLCFFWLADVFVDNVWMVRAFDVDESGVLSDLQLMLKDGAWKPLNYIYGSAHTYMTLAMIRAWSFVCNTNFTDLCFVARFVNALSLLGIGALFINTQLKKVAPHWAFLFLLTLFFTGLDFSYALNSKPELLQAFFVVASVIVFKGFLEHFDSRRLFFAGALAGMAFATKYAGLLLLAFLTLCLFAAFFSRKRESRSVSLLCKWLVLLSSGAFLGVALLGSYLIIDFPIVSQVLGIHSTIIGQGFIFLDGKKWSEWLGILFSLDNLWWGLAIGLLPGAVLMVRDWRPSRAEWLPSALLALWVLFYLCYLIVMVKEKSARYLIILMPFCYCLVFLSLARFSRWLTEHGRKREAAILFVVSLTLVLFVTVSGTTDVANAVLAKAGSPRVEAGKWLSKHASHDGIVASDLYTYVPTEFRKHFHQPYLTAYDVIKVRPDYLVTSRTIMSRYLDVNKSEAYREGKAAFMRHYYLYAKLDEDGFPGYQRLKDFGEVIIYRKTQR